MANKLRPYQEEAIKAVEAALTRGITHQMVVMATGCGKTKTAVSVSEKYKRVLWITHTEDLIKQSALAFIKEKYDETIVNHIDNVGFIDYVRNGGMFAGGSFKMGLVKADAFFPHGNVVMASIQTLWRRLDRFKPEEFDLIVIDEAHLAASKTFRTTIEYFKPKLCLFLTATPHREDNLLLSDVCDEIVYDFGIKEGIDGKYLCELDAVRVKTTTSLDNVRTTGGELNQKDLAEEIDNPQRNQLVVSAYLKYAKGRQAIFYCVDVKHAVSLAQVFNDLGVKCKAVSSNEQLTPDRSQTIKDFKDEKLMVLTNCMILTTGVDIPNVGCIGMSSPTKSLTKYLQCLDDKTEILTKAGWKNIDTISKKDLSAAYNIKTGEILWKPIKQIFKRERAVGEDMYSVDLPGVDLRVTGGHRMIIGKRFGRSKISMPYSLMTAEDMSKTKNVIKIPVSGFQKSKGLPLTDWELVFLGLFISDGSINKRKNQMYIAQSAHQKWNKDIVECLNNCGIEYKFTQRTRKTQFSENSTMNYYYIGAKEIKRFLPWLDKNLNDNYEEITPHQLERLIHGLNLGDGAKRINSWKRHTFTISTGNINLVNNLQSICVRRGFRCNVAVTNSQNYTIHVKPFYTCKSLTFNGTRPKFKKEDSWKKEQVWCISNELETIVIRRSGKVAIIGNCVGRGTRLKNDKYVGLFGQNTIILDYIDSTSRHNLVNAWELDKLKEPEDRVFITEEKREKLLEERRKKKLNIAERKEDERVKLLRIPRPKLRYTKRTKEPATPAQLKWIADLGYDVNNQTYTKEMVSKIIMDLPATPKQRGLLKYYGYDVDSVIVLTRGMMDAAMIDYEKRKPKTTTK